MKVKFPLLEEALEKHRKIDELVKANILDSWSAEKLKQKIKKDIIKQLK